MSILKDIPLDLQKELNILAGGHVFKNGEIYTFIAHNKNWGVLKKTKNNQFEIVLHPFYDSTGYEEKVDLIVAVQYKDKKYNAGTNAYYLYDLEGNLVAQFLNVDSMHFDENSNILLKKNTKFGLLSDNFELLFPCQYAKLTSIKKGIFKAQKYDVNPETYQDYNHTFNGIIDAQNNVLGEFHAASDIFNHLYLDKVIVYEDWQYFSYDIKTSKTQILPFEKIINNYAHRHSYNNTPKYRTIIDIDNDAFPYFNSYALHDRKGKWGLIYPNGDVIIPNIYDYLEQIAEDYFRVALGEIEIDEDEENYVMTATNAKWGIIDSKQNIIVPIEYEWVWYIDKTQKVYANKGGVLTYDEQEWKPKWNVCGGENKEIIL